MQNIENNISPIITIIVAVYNGAMTLERCINSVLNQCYYDSELIIIDGGSTDGTQEIIQKYGYAINYWVSEPDNGIYDAWNKGLAQASGQWIAFLGVDDIYLEDALQAYACYLAKSKNNLLEYVSSQVNLVDGERLIRTIGKPWSWNAFRRYMNVAHVGSLHNKMLFEQYGSYDITYKICADYEFLLRSRDSLKAGFLDVTTVSMNIGGVSDSYLALQEAERAKIISGGRSVMTCRIEKIMAIVSMCMRKWLWY